jgi:hypothetical protein
MAKVPRYALWKVTVATRRRPAASGSTELTWTRTQRSAASNGTSTRGDRDEHFDDHRVETIG